MAAAAIAASCGDMFNGDPGVELLLRDCPDDEVFVVASRLAAHTGPEKRDFEDHDKHGGYKRMYMHGDGTVMLVQPPTVNPRILRMSLREGCIQTFLGKHSISPEVLSVTVLKEGTLLQPVYEYWQTMRQMDGTLQAWLQEERRAGELREMLVSVVSRLGELNALGIRHNDAKLDNIMYMSKGGREEWKVIDLGLATVDGDSGCDIWFFFWWMWHRAHEALCKAGLLRVAKWVLCVNVERVPDDLHEQIMSRVLHRNGKRYFDFCTATSTTHKTNAWFFGDVRKADLYRLGSRMRPPHVCPKKLIALMKNV